VGLVDRSGSLESTTPLPPGAKVTLSATVSNPWWSSWLTGTTLTRTATVTAPVATLAQPVGVATAGSGVTLSFNQPVSTVTWTFDGITHRVNLPSPSSQVTVDLPAGHAAEGTLTVSAAAYTWEALSPPSPFTFFTGTGLQAVSSPAPGSDPSPSDPITLTFSRSVASLFGSKTPTVSVALLHTPPAGRWSSPNPYTLTFQPDPGALWPGQDLEIQLPAAVSVGGSAPTASLSYQLAQGPVLRLQEELAALGYLPLRFVPAAGQPGAPATVAAAAAADTTAPAGSFAWQWAPPAGLAALWQPGQYTVMTEAAVKAFENVSGLAVVGESNPLLWPTLAQALAGGHTNPNGYTWVSVSETLPETLIVWHDGANVITSPTNTGIPQDPTAPGTFIVYLRYTSQIMRGTNPDGTKYADPVKWVSYFNGSDAIHGFSRASYGFPQSLGCAELPYPTAQQVYPYTPIGTLVTVS
jgi:lipoprotein-anchoring transpeptidase ErfK/SrfK